MSRGHTSFAVLSLAHNSCARALVPIVRGTVSGTTWAITCYVEGQTWRSGSVSFLEKPPSHMKCQSERDGEAKAQRCLWQPEAGLRGP